MAEPEEYRVAVCWKDMKKVTVFRCKGYVMDGPMLKLLDAKTEAGLVAIISLPETLYVDFSPWKEL